MKLYYDLKPVYPYICLGEINEQELKQFISFIKSKGISIIKFYEKPKYPASDGITYDFLLRINYANPEKRIKPEKSTIENIFSEFKGIKKTANTQNQVLEEEKNYFKQIRTFLNSERKIFELDRQFFKEQLETLNKISSNLKKENTRIFKFIDDYNNKITNEITQIVNNKNFNNEDIKLLENKLSEKEKAIKKKENDLKEKENELEVIKNDYDDYREKLNKEYSSMIKDIRNLNYGIDAQKDEDSIQDLRILVFGNSKLTSKKIYEIFNEIFFKTFGEDLDKKCLEANLLDYKKIKNSNINRKIKQDKYDYIIAGQHDHSTKGKNSKHSYVRFAKDNNLKAIVSEQYDSPFNTELLTELANTTIKNWEEQFEIIE